SSLQAEFCHLKMEGWWQKRYYKIDLRNKAKRSVAVIGIAAYCSSAGMISHRPAGSVGGLVAYDHGPVRSKSLVQQEPNKRAGGSSCTEDQQSFHGFQGS